MPQARSLLPHAQRASSIALLATILQPPMLSLEDAQSAAEDVAEASRLHAFCSRAVSRGCLQLVRAQLVADLVRKSATLAPAAESSILDTNALKDVTEMPPMASSILLVHSEGMGQSAHNLARLLCADAPGQKVDVFGEGGLTYCMRMTTRYYSATLSLIVLPGAWPDR